MTAETDRSDYWNEFYSRARPRGANPSQFAVFVLGELGERSSLLDIGCGSGRDSFFFASQGHRVIGIDASAAAIEECQKIADEGEDDISFSRHLVDDDAIAAHAQKQSSQDGGNLPTVVYARFFVHAITDEEEQAFIATAAKCCANGGRFAVEFRTKRDANQEKVTAAHYRRFVDPLKFLERVVAAGFSIDYYVEGYGFAKYKQDDAYVARVMLTRR